MSPTPNTGNPNLDAALADLAIALNAGGDQAPHHTQMTRFNQKALADAAGLRFINGTPLPSPWEAALLLQHNDSMNLARRVNNLAVSFDALILADSVGYTQTGQTNNQAPTSPTRTAAADNLAAGAAPADRIVDTTAAVGSGSIVTAMAGISTALSKQVDATVAPVVATVADLQTSFAQIQATLADMQAALAKVLNPAPATPAGAAS